MRNIRVGLIGLGTVGSGVLHILRNHTAELERRTGTTFQITRFASRSPEKWTSLGMDASLGTTDPEEVAAAPDVDLLVELMSGVEVPRRVLLRAFETGKNVVTANKALLSECGDEIFAAATRAGRKIGFEASVCGGVPIIQLLKTGFASENIRRVVGIVNGTCNFILTEMTQRRAGLAETLAEAQRRGFAEADPTLDVNGMDSAHKLTLLAMLAWGVRVSATDVRVQGIEGIATEDIAYADEMGMTIKLLAVARRDDADRIGLSVDPTLVPSSSVIGQVHGAVNAVLIDGEHVGPLVMTGAGAGQMPTANAVVADMIEIARVASSTAPCDEFPTGVPEEGRARADILPPDEIPAEYYLRFTALDRPGVLANIATHLAQNGISIAQVVQHGRDRHEAVPVIILTHEATAGAIRESIARVDASAHVTRPTVVMNVLREVP